MEVFGCQPTQCSGQKKQGKTKHGDTGVGTRAYESPHADTAHAHGIHVIMKKSGSPLKLFTLVGRSSQRGRTAICATARVRGCEPRAPHAGRPQRRATPRSGAHLSRACAARKQAGGACPSTSSHHRRH
eukprot:955091-Prymnesium_polylepis.1